MARSATQLPIPSTSPLLQAALMGTCGVLFGAVTAILFGMNPLLAFAAAGAACLMIGVTLTGDVSRVVRVGIAFILPMNADIHFFDENMRLSLSSLAVLLLYAHWLITLATNHKEEVHLFPRISAPAFLLLLVTGLSLVASGGSLIAMTRLFEPICDVLLFLYLANWLRTERDVREIVWAILLGSAIQCGAALVEAALEIELDLLFSHAAVPLWQQDVGAATYSRISGLMEHPNMLAIYLSTTVVLLICLAFTGSRRAAGVACWMGAAICVFVTIDTFSRSGWFVLSAFAPVVFVHQLWRRGNLARAVLPLTAVVALITVAALLSPVKVSDRLTIDESVMSREHMIAVGTNMIRHHPFFGVGLGNYVDLQYSYDETDIGITTIFPHILHNIYFLIAAEQGLLGLLAFLWLNLSIALLGLRFVRGPTSFLSNMGIAFWCTIFMFFVFGMVNPLPRFTYVFAPLGVLVAIHRIIELQDAGEGHGHAEA